MAVAPALASAQTTPAAEAPRKFTLATHLLNFFESSQRNLVEAAEKMPEEHYGFKPTSEIRTFGEVLLHVAYSQFGTCSVYQGATNPHAGRKPEPSLAKAEVVKLLKESSDMCRGAFKTLTDENVLEFISVQGAGGGGQVQRANFVSGTNAHAFQSYGALGVYMRLKGLVPPSTQRALDAQKKTQ
jgi:uncharacterized damage-inducible protein DinB